ncbi:MAG: hypothetical protein IT230_13475 [Flavobacteriales bacterium]|nr:hypothetical protein [Flavobacteriales bacterium]
MKKAILALALLATVTSCRAQQMASMPHAAPATDTKTTVSGAYLALNQDMRKLWMDHMFWTLSTVDAFYNEPEQLDGKLKRLLNNQVQIGQAIVPYYGQAAGDQLGKLLTAHIQLAVPVLTAAKANDQAALDKGLKAWYANAQEVADLLSAANPQYWPQSATRPALEMHITQTTGYAVDILKGDFSRSIQSFEDALHHMLGLADILSDGITNQFPDKFRN